LNVTDVFVEQREFICTTCAQYAPWMKCHQKSCKEIFNISDAM